MYSQTESERDILALGLSFGIALKAVPVVDIIAVVESAANKLLKKKSIMQRSQKSTWMRNREKHLRSLGMMTK